MRGAPTTNVRPVLFRFIFFHFASFGFSFFYSLRSISFFFFCVCVRVAYLVAYRRSRAIKKITAVPRIVVIRCIVVHASRGIPTMNRPIYSAAAPGLSAGAEKFRRALPSRRDFPGLSGKPDQRRLLLSTRTGRRFPRGKIQFLHSVTPHFPPEIPNRPAPVPFGANATLVPPYYSSNTRTG